MLKQIVMAITATGFLASCAVNAPVVGSGKVSYGDSNAVETVNTDFGSTDLNMVANQMATQLIRSGKINQCKTYTVTKVRNKTDQYIDTENITQTIVDQLSNSPQVTSTYVISTQEMQNQVDELDRQNQSGLYGSKAQIGKMKGAQCQLDGFVSNITKADKNVKDVFYIFNMKLINIEQGSQVWTGQKQIRKDMVK